MAINPSISLIVSTYGRFKEVNDLLESLAHQEAKDDFEVIIVDQNDVIDLSSIVNKYTALFNIIHYKSAEKGLSKAKNKGLKLSSAPIVSFPDDDCKYYPDTITSALKLFRENPEIDIIYGRLFDRENNKNIMRNWNNKPLKLTKYNFHLNYSAVTCFTRKKELLFNENFGVGSTFGSGEELNYVMEALNKNYHVSYTPDLSIWHPELNIFTMSKEKVYAYALGYGAIFRKNLNFQFSLIFISSVIFQILRIINNYLKFNDKGIEKAKLSFKGRLNGFFNYIEIKKGLKV